MYAKGTVDKRAVPINSCYTVSGQLFNLANRNYYALAPAVYVWINTCFH